MTSVRNGPILKDLSYYYLGMEVDDQKGKPKGFSGPLMDKICRIHEGLVFAHLFGSY